MKKLTLLILAFALLAPVLHAETKPPGLVDRLLDMLGNKNLPPLQILPPPGSLPAPSTPKKTPTTGAHGLEIATSFFPIYDLDAGSRDDAPAPMSLPFFASGTVNTPRRNVLSLVVMIPDSDREAARAYAFARTAQDIASLQHPDWYASNALVLAPQFLNPEDIAGDPAQWPDGGASLLKWTGASWIYGGDSAAAVNPNTLPAPRTMSSFEALDFILLAVARHEIFPDLERVVIAGSGAGGDFVQRYAALGLAPEILGNDGIKVRYVAANAWSFMYFDKTRAQLPEAGVYTPPSTETVFSEPKADSCASYNIFPYGLNTLPLYGRKQGETAIRLRYDQRVALYLTGKNATHPLPDSAPGACALVMQGRSLSERARIFYQHLTRLYGDNLPQTQRLYEIPEVAEEAPALWKSPCGVSALFGDGACTGETGDKLKVLQ